MDFCNLASGSKGNCSYISDGKTSILIDVGISYKSLKERCEIVGIDLSRINAIFITHEHDDHIKGVKKLTDTYDIPVYVHPQTYNASAKILGLVCNVKLSEFIYPIQIGNLFISAFRVSHDAQYTQGYVVSDLNKKIVLATDLGYVTDSIFKKMIDADFVYIESNYDEEMLINGPYPENLKRRIQGKKGHLSNIQSSEQIVKLVKEYNVNRFMLAHLSEKNNTEEKALETLFSILKSNQIKLDSVEIAIANQYNPSKVITI